MRVKEEKKTSQTTQQSTLSSMKAGATPKKKGNSAQKNNSDISVVYTCNNCQKTFVTPAGHKYHVTNMVCDPSKKRSRESIASINETSDTNDEKLSCAKCHQIFATKDDLVYHKRWVQCGDSSKSNKANTKAHVILSDDEEELTDEPAVKTPAKATASSSKLKLKSPKKIIDSDSDDDRPVLIKSSPPAAQNDGEDEEDCDDGSDSDDAQSMASEDALVDTDVKRSKGRPSLKKNKKRKASNSADNKCDKCGRVFTSIGGLKYHLEKAVCDSKRVSLSKSFDGDANELVGGKRYSQLKDEWLQSEFSQSAIQRFLSTKPSSNCHFSNYDLNTSDIKTYSLGMWVENLKSMAAKDSAEGMEILSDSFRVPDVTFLVSDTISETSVNLSPFQGANMSVGDVFLNCCGPVWSLSFTSSPAGSGHSHPYLAVGLGRIGWYAKDESLFQGSQFTSGECKYDIGSTGIHVIGSRSYGPSAIEIWGPFTGVTAPELLYCITFANSGPIWQCQWCPHFTPTEHIIGYLAVVCGNGSCVILAVPRLTRATSSNPETSIPCIDSSQVIYTTLATQETMFTCCDWNTLLPNQIACGCSDGSVCVWDLPNRQFDVIQPVMRLIDFSQDHTKPSLSTVQSVQFCPFNPRLLLSGGSDGYVKVWDTQRIGKPLLMTSYQNQLNGVTAVTWDPCGNGVYYGNSDSSSVTWHPLWSNVLQERAIMYEHHCSFGCVWGVHANVEDGHSMVYSAASDGSVHCLPPAIGSMKRHVFGETIQLCRILSCDEIFQADAQSSGQCLHVNMEGYKVTNRVAPETKLIPSSNTSMHCVTTTSIASRDSVVAYGGAMGIVRIQKTSPILPLVVRDLK